MKERMILDITAIKEYKNIDNIQKLSMNLEVEKLNQHRGKDCKFKGQYKLCNNNTLLFLF